MKKKLMRVVKLLGAGSLIVISFLYLLCCAIPFVHPGKFWFISILGLIFPFLVAAFLVCLIVLIIRKSKFSFLLAAILLLSWQQLSVAFGMHIWQRDASISQGTTLRIFSWNVFRWDEQNRKARGGVSNRGLMLKAIAAQDADVLCLQEFFEPYEVKDFESNLGALKDMGYPFQHFYPSSQLLNGRFKFGMVIASRYPIIDSFGVSFGQTPHSEGLCGADIQVRDKVIRVMCTHMESSRLDNKGYLGFSAMEKNGTGPLSWAKRSVMNLIRAYNQRYDQAQLVRNAIKESAHPVILCGNLGDIPNSYSYFRVRGNLEDVFLEKGAGLGRTFRFFSPNLRIDYIFADRALRVRTYTIPHLTYSDHYPQVAEFEIP